MCWRAVEPGRQRLGALQDERPEHHRWNLARICTLRLHAKVVMPSNFSSTRPSVSCQDNKGDADCACTCIKRVRLSLSETVGLWAADWALPRPSGGGAACCLALDSSACDRGCCNFFSPPASPSSSSSSVVKESVSQSCQDDCAFAAM